MGSAERSRPSTPRMSPWSGSADDRRRSAKQAGSSWRAGQAASELPSALTYGGMTGDAWSGVQIPRVRVRRHVQSSSDEQ